MCPFRRFGHSKYKAKLCFNERNDFIVYNLDFVRVLIGKTCVCQFYILKLGDQRVEL